MTVLRDTKKQLPLTSPAFHCGNRSPRLRITLNVTVVDEIWNCQGPYDVLVKVEAEQHTARRGLRQQT